MICEEEKKRKEKNENEKETRKVFVHRMMIMPLGYSDMFVGLSEKREVRFQEFVHLVASVVRWILNLISKITSTMCLVK